MTGRPDGSGSIVVCPLELVPATAARLGVRSMITLLGDPAQAPAPPGVTDHTVVHVNDITKGNDTQILATGDHIEAVVDAARRWDRSAPLLIHCLVGISRSPACAFIAACALQPDRDEYAIARELRRASPTARPNPWFIELADDLLGRNGRMTGAIAAIGQGIDADVGGEFALTVHG